MYLSSRDRHYPVKQTVESERVGVFESRGKRIHIKSFSVVVMGDFLLCSFFGFEHNLVHIWLDILEPRK